jgi:hypothetical protein
MDNRRRSAFTGDIMTDTELENLLITIRQAEKRNCGDWFAYSRMKSKIENIGLTCEQYDKAIKFITSFLGL